MSNRMTKLLTAAFLVGGGASALASPRTLPSGAPACGNTMGKIDCVTPELAAKREAEDRAQQEAAAATLADLLASVLPWPVVSKG